METVDVLSPSAADASVRPARVADLPAIGAVHARAWTITYREVFPEDMRGALTPEAMSRAWRPHLEATGTSFHHLLVACTGPTVVGFAAFGRAPEQPGAEPSDGELPTLLVDPTHLRRGHGSRLLAAGVDLLREDGAGRLLTWVHEDDAPRQRFLESAGFAADGASRRLSAGSPDVGVRELRYVAALGQSGQS